MLNKNTAIMATVEIYHKLVLAMSSWFSLALPIMLKDYHANWFLKFSVTMFIFTLIVTISEQYCNFKSLEREENKFYENSTEILSVVGYLLVVIALLSFVCFIFSI